MVTSFLEKSADNRVIGYQYFHLISHFNVFMDRILNLPPWIGVFSLTCLTIPKIIIIIINKWIKTFLLSNHHSLYFDLGYLIIIFSWLDTHCHRLHFTSRFPISHYSNSIHKDIQHKNKTLQSHEITLVQLCFVAQITTYEEVKICCLFIALSHMTLYERKALGCTFHHLSTSLTAP